MSNRGELFVVSSPSGGGKTSVIREAMKDLTGIVFSVSTTTRPPRRGEVEGKDYTFVSREAFDRLIEEGAFLEWAEVHGHLYGTSRSNVEAALSKGSDVILDIDVQGAGQVKNLFPEAAMIFILPPSYEELRRRLVRRHSDDPETVERRLEKARWEMNRLEIYTCVIINDRLDDAVEDLKSIIRAFRLNLERMEERILSIITSFPE